MVIILLATVALTLMVPAVSGISLLQKTKAETSGHNGKDGTNDCFSAPLCHVNGGKGGSGPLHLPSVPATLDAIGAGERG